MTPFVTDPDFTLYVGDVREVLATLPDESVHCCVTSPPYWGLRDYGHDGQIGLEATPEAYVQTIVDVFRHVRRVLRRDGTCWLNIGDSYASNPAKGGSGPGAKQGAHQGYGRPSRPGSGRADGIVDERGQRNRDGVPATHGLKEKDLVGIPWRLAFALQADGWYLRSDIIWSKPNPMPESVTDRPTKAHEYVFLLTRSPRYYFDADAVREKAEWARWGDQTYSPEAEKMYGQRIKPRPKADLTPRNDGDRWNEANGRGFIPNNGGRNIRSVWEIATQPYSEAHFATFPEALVERCILAGTSERGCCPVCGAPWEREVERQPLVLKEPAVPISERRADAVNDKRTALSGTQLIPASAKTIGWKPSCEHVKGYERMDHTDYLPAPVPCTVLDPFMGSGTTALVARRHGRRAVGIELNEEYARLAAERLSQLSLLAEASS